MLPGYQGNDMGKHVQIDFILKLSAHKGITRAKISKSHCCHAEISGKFGRDCFGGFLKGLPRGNPS